MSNKTIDKYTKIGDIEYPDYAIPSNIDPANPRAYNISKGTGYRFENPFNQVRKNNESRYRTSRKNVIPDNTEQIDESRFYDPMLRMLANMDAKASSSFDSFKEDASQAYDKTKDNFNQLMSKGSGLWDKLLDSASSTGDDIANYLKNASPEERARLGFMASEQLSPLVTNILGGNKTNEDIDRLNFIADNFNIGHGIKKKPTRSIASDIYTNELAKSAQKKHDADQSIYEKYLEAIIEKNKANKATKE